MSTSDNQTEAAGFQFLKEKTPTWLYRVFILLPLIVGYMILGVILGPSILNLIDEPMIEDLSFLTEIALGLVAFTIGSELSLSSLKRLGSGIISIIFAESSGAFFWLRRGESKKIRGVRYSIPGRCGNRSIAHCQAGVFSA